MQTYQNTTSRSCVYDAFKMAGLPTTPEMMNGITGDEVIALLRKHGYSVALKGETVKVTGHFFIIRDYGKDFAHIEYHESVDEISDLTPEDIGAVAYKSKSAAILTRTTPSGTLYLTWRYDWSLIPDLFPAWHFPVVVRSMTGRKNPQRATGWAIVDTSKPIDLDTLEIISLLGEIQ